MKTIPLTRGLLALVDDSDYPLLSTMKWHALNQKGFFYAARSGVVGGKETVIHMHRLLLGFPAVEIDHRDGNTLNNQRGNLRKASKSRNQANRRKNRNGSSRYKGVSRYEYGWLAGIRVNGKRHHLGTFANESDAARAYDAAARREFGQFARCNFYSTQT